MVALPQFDYIFAVGILFAFLDAWNIGANDVANSFATSVSSRSLTLIQAMCIGAVCEFAGAVLAGARVTGTIKNDIIDPTRFEAEPSVLMLGMLCALIGSSTWLTVATKIGLPVSTTHCIVGGIIGVGIATLGGNGVQWGWDGVAQVFAAWGIAPVIAGSFGAILFTITKYGVMKRKNPLLMGMISIPIYFGITSGVLTMVIVWKGAASLDLDDWPTANIVGTIFGVGGGVAILSIAFLLPYIYRKLVLEDRSLKGWEVIYGPMLLRRGPVPPLPASNVEVVRDYYKGHMTRAQLEQEGLGQQTIDDIESVTKQDEGASSGATTSDTSSATGIAKEKDKQKKISVAWYSASNLFKIAKRAFFRGVMVDVVEAQGGGRKAGGKRNMLVGNIEDKHARVEHFDNKVEHLFSFLQVMTAATASFAHGANDVSNAMGPLSSIYYIWQNNATGEDAPVPIWILVFGGSAIAIGLWTYGYNLMRNLGNRITLHSPSRGFCMELGAALTVVLATRLALPISTTQCIIGATVGVGLCSGDLKAINWRMVAWAYAGWFITLPVAGLISGLIMAFVINAPQFGNAL